MVPRSPRRANHPGASEPVIGSPPLTAAAAAARILERLDGGDSVALAMSVDPRDAEPAGCRILVGLDGTAEGTLGRSELDEAAIALATAALAAGGVRAGLESVAIPGNGQVDLYLEVHHPTPELVIVGAGHIAQPLSQVGALLGFRVIVLDDRPEFATEARFPEARRVGLVDFADPFRDVPIRPTSHVVLVTRGHKYDFECLRRVLAADTLPGYVGMIGSRRRIRATLAQLVDEGISRDRLRAVRAPVGLDVGAQTPAEIAVAVGAEIILAWRGGSGEPLSARENILDRFFPERPE